MPMLYYGLVVVGIAAIVLAVYNFIILRWCASHRGHMPQQPTPRSRGPLSIPPSFDNRNMQLAVSFKYKKEQGEGEDQEAGQGYECPVCLSPFEDGEEVRQLHRCKHSFHALCIHVWLYSHFNCPVCRAPVDPLFLRLHEPTDQSENSREVLIGSLAV